MMVLCASGHEAAGELFHHTRSACSDKSIRTSAGVMLSGEKAQQAT
jgi:hypothetical protein